MTDAIFTIKMKKKFNIKKYKERLSHKKIIVSGIS